ncbi:MAG: adenylate/guanylate cyclase domain-containing protein [Nevskia sp.]|nr:adenylate/guanylate cyclase domain-containing protein [Nevskia sp.]
MHDMFTSSAAATTVVSQTGAAREAPATARALYRGLYLLFVKGSVPATLVTIFLCFLGLQFSGRQWLLLTPQIPPYVAVYIVPELLLIRRYLRPLGEVWDLLNAGAAVPRARVSDSLVRALNLPYYAFLRVTLVRGSLGALVSFCSLYVSNLFWHGGFAPWQMVMFPALVGLFACPIYAAVEYFVAARHMVPVVERLWRYCTDLEKADQRRLIAVRLKSKLLYLGLFITAVPMLFIAFTVEFKVDQMLRSQGVDAYPLELPLWAWIGGALTVAISAAVAMSLLTAQEVSRSAARLIAGMNEVERGNLEIDLKVLDTDEYADLTRGFNLMTDGLREEVRILEVAQDLAGELHLDVLIGRIMSAAAELLDAERSTLFVYDPERRQLWSKFGVGLQSLEIRFEYNSGIAGAVFGSGRAENIVDPYRDPRFNPEVDRRTGFRTRSILCMPIVNKKGERLGVTQVLNKREGSFTLRDEQRLRAFTAQIAVALENAQLFNEVLSVKNYNENILASTTNGVVTLDNGGRVVTANGAALRMLGRDAANTLNRYETEMFGEVNGWVLRSVERVRQSGSADFAADAELAHANGTLSSVNLTATPLKDASGQAIGVILSFEDQTREKRVRSTMARYMSKEVADQLLEAGEAMLGGQMQRSTILFADIRNFTTIAETLGARGTVALLNEYFEEMVEAIFQYGGVLDKYIGDAMMALFGVPFQGARDADNAVAVANAMLRRLSMLNGRRTAAGLPAIEIGIGIATGDVVVGNIGSPRRMEYTVIGDSVNLASRLEGATKAYRVKVLLSQATAESLTVPTPLREIDLLRVKGKDQPVTVYEALGHCDDSVFPNLDACLAAYAEGLRAYRLRAWREAAEAFQAALALHPGDEPSRIYLERCNNYAVNPPPAHWDGVSTLHSK